VRNAPLRPIRAAVEMDQRKFQDIRRLAEPAACQEFWAADGKELFATQLHGIETRPVAIAVTHRHVDVLAREIDMMPRGRNPEVDAGMRLGKVAESVH